MLIISKLLFWIPIVFFIIIVTLNSGSIKDSFITMIFGLPMIYFMARIFLSSPKRLNQFIPLLLGLFLTIIIFISHLKFKSAKR